MLRKSLLAACLLAAMYTDAQEKGSATPAAVAKPTAKSIDYKQVGAPMPSLVVNTYHDSVSAADTVATARLSRKQMMKREKLLKERMAQATITDDDLSRKGNLLVMMFNPTCSHCEDVTTMIEKNISLFNRSEIVLLANPSMKEYIPGFLTRHHVDAYPPMHLGTDSSGFIDKVYLYQTLPQINIYDTDRRLLKTYNGEVPIDSLKKYIQ